MPFVSGDKMHVMKTEMTPALQPLCAFGLLTPQRHGCDIISFRAYLPLESN